jgi:hypothetical protein
MADTTETQAADKEQNEHTETQQKLEELERKQTELQQQLLQAQAVGIMSPTRGKADKVSPARERLQTAASAAAKNPTRTQLMHYMKLKRNAS